jgi:Pyruvate/2-oxoacid:ferredoxin oxidoreductase gamma subunit
VVFNLLSLEKFGPTVKPGGIVIYDSTVIQSPPELDGVRVIGVPMTQVALDLGKRMVKNIVALGALQAVTRLFPAESFSLALDQALHGDCSMLELNKEAFARGGQAALEVEAGIG